MEITIKTSAENIEMANFLLAQAYQAAIENERWLQDIGVTAKQLEKAEKFRKALLTAFLG
jgi:hypothetical protein